MSDTKFTKGEWFVLDERVVMCGDSRVAYAYSGSSIPLTHHVKSNAHLIAAAPEMYELIKDLRHAVSMGGLGGGISNIEVLKSIDELLAKARGEK